MNKLIILVVVVLVGIGAFIWAPKSGGPGMPQEIGNAPMQKADDSMMKNEEAPAAASGGSYESYAPEKLARAATGDVVLFFRASWCPTCRTLDADIRAKQGEIPAGVTILDVDYDNSTPLKQKYGVTYQHTLVQVDADGNQIAKWTSSPNLADILARTK